MSIRVLLVDDHKIVREGLRALLQKQSDVTVVGEAENGRTGVRLAQELSPDIVIMDVAMPDLNGVEATRQLLTRVPRAKVVALSMHADRRFVVEMLQAGAAGYLLKDGAFEELARAIHTVVTGRTYLSPQVADIVVKNHLRRLPKTEFSLTSVLTAREREVLQLLAEGNTTRQVASRLGVSVKTVETHRQRIMQKLSAHSLADLTKYAIREGLTSLET